MTAKDPTEKIWKLMNDIEFAMIATHSGTGDAVRARPMAARAEPDDHAIYFLSDAGTSKDHEIEHNSNVCLTFADPRANNYVSVTGTAEVFADPGIVEKVWRAGDKAFYKGPQDPNIRVIRVTPDQGEYWEGAGLVASVVKMIKAAGSSERPNLGENAKVSM